MRPTPFSVDLRPDGDRTIVTPHGELDLATVGELGRSLHRIAGTIVIDLRDLSFLDSTGLRLLLEQTQRADAMVQLVDGSAPISRLFELTGLRDVLPFVTLGPGPLRSDETDAGGRGGPEEVRSASSTP